MCVNCSMALKEVGKVSSSICMVISNVHGEKTDGMLMTALFLPVFSQVISHFFTAFCPISWCLGLDLLWGILGSSFLPAAAGNVLLQELLRDGCSHHVPRSLCLWGRRQRCCSHPCQKPGSPPGHCPGMASAIGAGSLAWDLSLCWCLCPGPLEERARALSSRADLTWLYSGFSL